MAKNPSDRRDEETPGKRPKNTEAAADDRTLNVIQFALTDADSSAGPAKRGKKATATSENSLEEKPQAKLESSASRIPDSVLERFIPIGNNFYFPGGAEAFSREKNRLTTRSENAIVIQSMVAIARAESESGVVKVAGPTSSEKKPGLRPALQG